jgi:hypothetical protein
MRDHYFEGGGGRGGRKRKRRRGGEERRGRGLDEKEIKFVETEFKSALKKSKFQRYPRAR